MKPVIEVSGLRYRYPDGTRALDGIDFTLAAGECVALLGANGSGKTTFVMHLNGLLQGEGDIEVCGLRLGPGVDPQTLNQVRARIGLVFQDSDEQLFMPSVIEDVAFGPATLGLPPDEVLQRAAQALEQCGIPPALHNKAPYHLSSGEKRRVALAGVLAMEPQVLVLDEPTTSLDPPGQRELTHLLSALPQAKLLVTHDVDFACALASRAVFFERGRVAGDGPVAEIVRRFRWSRQAASPDRH